MPYPNSPKRTLDRAGTGPFEVASAAAIVFDLACGASVDRADAEALQ